MMDDARFQLLHQVDDKYLDALLDVWDAATETDVTNRSDDDLLRILAAVHVLTELGKRAKGLAETAVATHHERTGWALQQPGLGKVRTAPRFSETHDLGNAFTLVACRIYGDPDSPAAVDELPAQIKALVNALARLFPPSATLSLPNARAEGLKDEDVVVRTPIPPKVTFTPDKEL